MSQRQAKERDKEAGLQTPSREHVATPSNLSPGISYSHGKEPALHRALPLPTGTRLPAGFSARLAGPARAVAHWLRVGRGFVGDEPLIFLFFLSLSTGYN